MTKTYRQPKNRRPAGFTFVELAAVLFIVALVFSLSIPAVRSRSRTDADALKAASVIRELHDSAIARKKTYGLTFDLEERSIRWEGPEGKKRSRLHGLRAVGLPSRGEVRRGTLTVFFDPSGAREDLTVWLTGEDGRSFRVFMSGLGGRVTVHEDREG